MMKNSTYIVRTITRGSRTKVQVYSYAEWKESAICRVHDKNIHTVVFDSKCEALAFAHSIMGNISVSNINLASAAVVGC